MCVFIISLIRRLLFSNFKVILQVFLRTLLSTLLITVEARLNGQYFHYGSNSLNCAIKKSLICETNQMILFYFLIFYDGKIEVLILSVFFLIVLTSARQHNNKLIVM